MPSKNFVASRPAMYNTPAIRNGGFGALQVEALTNRPMSIARRHLAASQLRIREIEPDELSSTEWIRFLAMEEHERNRFISQFIRRRRNSDDSVSSEVAYDKEQEAQEEVAEQQRRQFTGEGPSAAQSVVPATAAEPAVSQWARQFDGQQASDTPYTDLRPMHARRAVTSAVAFESPPSYNTIIHTRASTPPPAYEPRSDDEGGMSPGYTRHPGDSS